MSLPYCAEAPWTVLNQTKGWKLSSFGYITMDEMATRRVSSSVNGHYDVLAGEHVLGWLEKNSFELYEMCIAYRDILKTTSAVYRGVNLTQTGVATRDWVKSTPLYKAVKEELDKAQSVKLTVEFPNGQTEVRYLQEGEGFTISAAS